MDDQNAPALTPKEVAANVAAMKLQRAAKNPRALTAENSAQSSSITVVPKYAKGGKVRGGGCAVRGVGKGSTR